MLRLSLELTFSVWILLCSYLHFTTAPKFLERTVKLSLSCRECSLPPTVMSLCLQPCCCYSLMRRLVSLLLFRIWRCQKELKSCLNKAKTWEQFPRDTNFDHLVLPLLVQDAPWYTERWRILGLDACQLLVTDISCSDLMFLENQNAK